MTLNVAGQICFSEGLDLKDNDAETDAFWKSLELNAPYAQYLSVMHWLYSLTYYLTSIPALKSRMLLTEHNDPGIGRVIKVRAAGEATSRLELTYVQSTLKWPPKSVLPQTPSRSMICWGRGLPMGSLVMNWRLSYRLHCERMFHRAWNFLGVES